MTQMDETRAAALAFLLAWERAESNRGCYSCSEVHDNRCPAGWAGKTEDRSLSECACGRVELDAAAAALRKALGMEP
jgi:hypothetical protein